MGHTCCDDSDSAVRPCDHNDWDDVRTRKGFKVLRCRICQGRWKIPSSYVRRCMPFLHDCCQEGEGCRLLHVRRRKSSIFERFEQFGDSVLEGVSHDIQRKAKNLVRENSSDSDSEDDGPPELLDEEVY